MPKYTSYWQLQIFHYSHYITLTKLCLSQFCFFRCIDVTGAYSAQKTELNISLTAIGLLWTSTDFIAKGLLYRPIEDIGLI